MIHTPTSFSYQRRPFLECLLALACVSVLASCSGGGGDAGTGSGSLPPPGPPVYGPGWWGFGRDAQHSALGAIASQDLDLVSWSTPLDLAPQYASNGTLLTHYGSPVVTSHNTVILPVKTGAAGGFRLEARSGGNGGVIWTAATDYQLPPHNWVPSYNVALTAGNRLYAPGSGGKLLIKDDADAASGALRSVVFYGAGTYNATPAAFDAGVFINTPLTVDAPVSYTHLTLPTKRIVEISVVDV